MGAEDEHWYTVHERELRDEVRSLQGVAFEKTIEEAYKNMSVQHFPVNEIRIYHANVPVESYEYY
jgi:hypothetical protein